jgi:P-type Mg2+ transporter
MDVAISRHGLGHRAAVAHARAEADELLVLSRLSREDCCARLQSGARGLAVDDASQRLKSYGPNLVVREHKPTVLQELWRRARNPLNALLLTLAGASYVLGDMRAAVVIVLMIVLAIGTAFIQEHSTALPSLLNRLGEDADRLGAEDEHRLPG